MALALSSCICTTRPAWMQHARTPAKAVHGIPRHTQRDAKTPVRGLVLAGASQVAQGVSTYQDTKLQELALIKAHAPIDGASGDEKPSLWSLMKSTLRVVAVIGVAAIMLLGNTDPAFARSGGRAGGRSGFSSRSSSSFSSSRSSSSPTSSASRSSGSSYSSSGKASSGSSIRTSAVFSSSSGGSSSSSTTIISSPTYSVYSSPATSARPEASIVVHDDSWVFGMAVYCFILVMCVWVLVWANTV